MAKNTNTAALAALPHVDALAAAINADKAYAVAMGGKQAAAVLLLLSSAKHGEFTVAEVAKASGKSEASCAPRCSEYNVGARLTDATTAVHAIDLIQGLWLKSEGAKDRADAVRRGCRAAIVGARDGAKLPELRKVSGKVVAERVADAVVVKAGKDAAKREPSHKTAEVTKITPPAKGADLAPMVQAIAAWTIAVKASEHAVRAEAAHAALVAGLENLALLASQYASLI